MRCSTLMRATLRSGGNIDIDDLFRTNVHCDIDDVIIAAGCTINEGLDIEHCVEQRAAMTRCSTWMRATSMSR